MIQGNAIYLHATAGKLAEKLQSIPESSPEHPIVQSAFGLTLLHLYELTFNTDYLDAGLGAVSLAVASQTSESGDLLPTATFLIRNWVYSQRLLARRDQTTEPVLHAIDLGNMTFNLSAECYPSDRGGRRLLGMELAECLLDHYRASGHIQDLDDALRLVHSVSEGEDAEDTHSFCVLAELHLERFLRLGKLEDIDKALYNGLQLQHFHEDTPAATPSHPDAARGLHVLALSSAQRATVVMSIEDLDRAVTYARSAVRMTPQTHPLYPVYTSDLAFLLQQRFLADNDVADLDEAMEKLKRITTGDLPRSYIHYPPAANLGIMLACHGDHAHDIVEIDQGINHLTIARKAFYGGAHLEARIERDLATALFSRFQQTQARDDLDEAIRYTSSALERAPVDDQSRGGLALQLGRLYVSRHQLSLADADLDLAIETLRTVAIGKSTVLVRLPAAIEWAKAASVRGPAASLEALKVSLDVLPLVAWSGNRMVVQYKTLSSITADVGPWAASCAIACGQYEDAVGYLERGRNVLWVQSLKLQPGARTHRDRTKSEPSGTSSALESSSLSSYLSSAVHNFPQAGLGEFEAHSADLERQNPRLFSVIQNLRLLHDDMVEKLKGHVAYQPGDLDKIEVFKSMFTGVYQDASLHGAANRWSSLQKAVEQLENDDADSPGSVLGHASLPSLLAEGHVIYLNVHPSRCDTLILRRGPDGSVDIDHVPLPDLSVDEARGWAEAIQIGMYDVEERAMGVRDFENIILIPILQGLWRTVASRVLSCLQVESDQPTRIWWCPTGPLAFLPLHAAGPYEDGAPGFPELVISSYTSTLHALLRAYDVPKAPLAMLAVGQPDTPGLSPLPAVHKELACVRRACARVGHTPTLMVGADATIFAVSRALPSHTWLHMSCHAHQDADYAFDSAFFVHNGSLKLRELMQLNLSRMQFAFLSACLTSAGDTRLPDECIHLAGGVQFAGVKSAVATLWSVDDRAAAFVTESVYGRMMREGVVEPDAREAAEALHATVDAMKAAGRPMLLWVPFIHVGI